MKSLPVGLVRACVSLAFASSFVSLALATDQTVDGNLSVTGDTDLGGNTLSFGTRTDSATTPGLSLLYSDGTVPTIYFNATRPTANWLWQSNTSTTQMQLDATNTLSLVNPATGLATIILNPAMPLTVTNNSTGEFSAYASRLNIRSYNNSSISGPTMVIAKARGTLSAPAIVAIGDSLGSIAANGYDGSTFWNGTRIESVVDNSPSSGKIPSALLFSTTNAAGVLAARMRITSDGNVGIGTAAPAEALDVVGNAKISGSLTVAGVPVLTSTGSGSGLTGLNASQLTTGTVSVAVLPTSVVQANTTQTLTNKTLVAATLSGNTSLQGGDLTVSGGVGIGGNTLSFGTRTDLSTTPGLSLLYSDGTVPTVYFNATRPTANWLWQSNTSAPQMQLDATNTLSLVNPATGLATIILNPAMPLTVMNNSVGKVALNGQSISIQRSSDNSGILGAGIYFLKSRGTVSSPTALIQGDVIHMAISQGYTGSEFRTGTRMDSLVDAEPSSDIIPGAFVFKTANIADGLAERVRISSSGNVGIGTATPSEKLDVVGNAKISGTLTVGGQLVVTANQLTSYATTSQLTTINASSITSGTLDATRLAPISLDSSTLTGSLAWSRVDKTGAALADLSSRAFADLQSKPTTLDGYGITNAVQKAANGDVAVTGATSLQGNATVGGATALQGTLTVAGATTLQGNVTVTGLVTKLRVAEQGDLSMGNFKSIPQQ